MLVSLLSLLALLPAPAVVGPASRVSADTLLHCRVQATAEGKRRCSIRVPKGRAIQACSEEDRKAGRCDKAGKHLAWVVASPGAKCKISKKRTDWARKVTLSMSGKTPAGPGTCDLYVALQ